MLALAIISTIILSIFILTITGSFAMGDDEPIGFVMIILLSFVLICIWILYAR